ncbi:MAG TPA: hypothetical protein VFM37_15640, partial [Pseudonocardiaceae bacterium]|nr:hypothetical protein [Pseudonocardiaceae bacterium]
MSVSMLDPRATPEGTRPAASGHAMAYRVAGPAARLRANLPLLCAVPGLGEPRLWTRTVTAGAAGAARERELRRPLHPGAPLRLVALE